MFEHTKTHIGHRRTSRVTSAQRAAHQRHVHQNIERLALPKRWRPEQDEKLKNQFVVTIFAAMVTSEGGHVQAAGAQEQPNETNDRPHGPRAAQLSAQQAEARKAHARCLLVPMFMLVKNDTRA